MRTFWRVLLFCVCASGVLWAQVDRGSITGTVNDPTGAALPGVVVTLVEMQTGVAYEGDTTNGLGIYRVLNLPVGQYALTFSKDGFKTYERTGVTVSMSQNVTLKMCIRDRNFSGPARLRLMRKSKTAMPPGVPYCHR